MVDENADIPVAAAKKMSKRNVTFAATLVVGLAVLIGLPILRRRLKSFMAA
jgi:hypothetical protein